MKGKILHFFLRFRSKINDEVDVRLMNAEIAKKVKSRLPISCPAVVEAPFAQMVGETFPHEFSVLRPSLG